MIIEKMVPTVKLSDDQKEVLEFISKNYAPISRSDLEFILSEETDLSEGVKVTFNETQQKAILDNPKLYSIEVE